MPRRYGELPAAEMLETLLRLESRSAWPILSHLRCFAGAGTCTLEAALTIELETI